MALQRAYVFRQLDGASRFSRFGAEDMVAPILVLVLATFSSLAFDFHPLYAAVLFGAVTAASWVLRTQLEDPPMQVLFYVVSPKHFTPLAPDRYHKPYPGAPSLD